MNDHSEEYMLNNAHPWELLQFLLAFPEKDKENDYSFSMRLRLLLRLEHSVYLHALEAETVPRLVDLINTLKLEMLKWNNQAQAFKESVLVNGNSDATSSAEIPRYWKFQVKNIDTFQNLNGKSGSIYSAIITYCNTAGYF